MSGARKLKPEPAAQPWAVVEKGDLLAALELPASVAPRKGVVPILACLRLEVDRGELLIDGTDLDLGARTTCPVRSHDWRPGAAVAVDGQLLQAVVAAAPKGGEVRLALGENGLLVRHALERARLAVLPADEFPAIREPEGVGVEILVDGEALATGLARVAPAISREETRYYLNGVFLETAKGSQPGLLLTATDGHRLHHTRLAAGEILEREDRPTAAILPRRLVELLAGAAGELKLRVYPAGVSVAGGMGLITSRLIDATYPDWRRIVPGQGADGLELVGAELVDAVQRLRRFGDGAVVVRLEPERIALQGATDGGADLAETSVAGQARGRPAEMETGFKGRYLADAARIAGGAMVLGWSGPNAPMRVDYPDRPDDVTIVMPMRGAGWREVG